MAALGHCTTKIGKYYNCFSQSQSLLTIILHIPSTFGEIGLILSECIKSNSDNIFMLYRLQLLGMSQEKKKGVSTRVLHTLVEFFYEVKKCAKQQNSHF